MSRPAFGFALATAGYVDGDVRSDLLVGDPAASVVPDDAEGLRRPGLRVAEQHRVNPIRLLDLLVELRRLEWCRPRIERAEDVLHRARVDDVAILERLKAGDGVSVSVVPCAVAGACAAARPGNSARDSRHRRP